VDNLHESRGPSAQQGSAQSKQQSPDSISAGALLALPARGFVRFLYSSNPFYILSADLVIVGLRISFGSGGPMSRSWALWLGLAGYTLLLATTACFLIRKGKLWDDLRSILLLIVMMFVAMAMSADDAMATDSQRGALACLAGFVFAVAVTESVLRGIRLGLPPWYRAAYYAILALVFLYPIALAPASGAPESPRLQWALFGFSPLASLAFLLLVPAARRGAFYVAKNGSPWRWPLYPWSLFLVLAGGVGIRCYSLCVSFHFVNGAQTIFGPYFLVPIGLALCLIWLEIGIAARRQGVMFAASAAPLFLALLASTGHRYEAVYMNFLDIFRDTLGGSPLFLTLIAAAIFLAYAVARRVPHAWDLLSVALFALAFVGRQTLDLNQLVAPQSLPLAAAGLVLGSVARRKRHTFRGVLSCVLLVAAATRTWLEVWPSADWVVVAVHLLIVGMMAVGVYFDDWLGTLAQFYATVALLALGAASALELPIITHRLPANLAPWHALLVSLASLAFGILLRDRIYHLIASVIVATWVGNLSFQNYLQLRPLIAVGLLFFLIAAVISLKKAGLWPRSILSPIARLLRAETGASILRRCTLGPRQP
jgi:hypothetical protein